MNSHVSTSRTGSDRSTDRDVPAEFIHRPLLIQPDSLRILTDPTEDVLSVPRRRRTSSRKSLLSSPLRRSPARGRRCAQGRQVHQGRCRARRISTAVIEIVTVVRVDADSALASLVAKAEEAESSGDRVRDRRREAVEAFESDARWKYACGGLAFDHPGFAHRCGLTCELTHDRERAHRRVGRPTLTDRGDPGRKDASAMEVR